MNLIISITGTILALPLQASFPMSRKRKPGHLYEMGKQISELEDQAWSGEVEAELKKRWGRSFTAWLPLIWNQPVDPDLCAKVCCDYMDVVTRAVERDFSCQIGNWCRDHGVQYIGHLIEDNNQHSRTGSSLGHYFGGLPDRIWRNRQYCRSGSSVPGGEQQVSTQARKEETVIFIIMHLESWQLPLLRWNH